MSQRATPLINFNRFHVTVKDRTISNEKIDSDAAKKFKLYRKKGKYDYSNGRRQIDRKYFENKFSNLKLKSNFGKVPNLYKVVDGNNISSHWGQKMDELSLKCGEKN